MKKIKLLYVVLTAFLLCLLSQSAYAQKGKAKGCNCTLPDYGCNGNKKCLSSCYRGCVLGWIATTNLPVKEGTDFAAGATLPTATLLLSEPDEEPVLKANDRAELLPSKTISGSIWKLENTAEGLMATIKKRHSTQMN